MTISIPIETPTGMDLVQVHIWYRYGSGTGLDIGVGTGTSPYAGSWKVSELKVSTRGIHYGEIVKFQNID